MTQLTKAPRLEDWAERLDVFFAENLTRPFQRGQWDCALFAAEAYKVMTAADPGEIFRGFYDDAGGAQDILTENGFGSLDQVVTDLLGPPLESWRKAQRGDGVLFETSEGEALGIVDLSGKYFMAVTQDGLTRFPIRAAKKAWRV